MDEPKEPKYVQLKNFILNMIQSEGLKAEEKVYSDYELADKFHVSRHTVRQAMSDLVNEGWLYRVRGKGTFVAKRTERKIQSGIIGTVTTYLNDYIFPSIIRGIDHRISEHGCSIALGYTNNNVEKEALCLKNMLQQNLDGLIVEPTKSAFPNPNLDLYEEFSKLDIPLVFINGYYSNLQASYVIEDDELGGYLAAKHLLSLHHRRIAGIFKSDDIQGHYRYKGFVKAHREFGFPIYERSILWFTTEDFDIYSNPNYGQVLLDRLKDSTGLVCYNDQIALKILALLRERNIQVPQDLSVVSFDDSELSQITEVKLTSIAHPKEKLGRRAAEILLTHMQGSKSILQEKIPPQLTIRNSTRELKSY